jgi:hypothetical protein
MLYAKVQYLITKSHLTHTLAANPELRMISVSKKEEIHGGMEIIIKKIEKTCN